MMTVVQRRRRGDPDGRLTQPDEDGRQHLVVYESRSYGSGTELPGTRPFAAGSGPCAQKVGRAVLYLWPAEGWVRGTVARCRSLTAGPAPESRMWCGMAQYGCTVTSALGSAVTPSRPNAASHGPTDRWGLLVRSAR